MPSSINHSQGIIKLSPELIKSLNLLSAFKKELGAYQIPELFNLGNLESFKNLGELTRSFKELGEKYSLVNSIGLGITLQPEFLKFQKLFAQLGQAKIISPLVKLEYRLNVLNFIEENIVTDEEKQIIVIQESKRIQEIILDIYRNNTKLLTLSPRQFEEMIAELLRNQGFKVELTKQTRDGGYDILALYDMAKHTPQKWLVECKRYTENAVGIDIIRSFKEVVQSNNANRGIIATTSYFTKDAIAKRKETPYLLDFKDKNDIIDWVVGYANQFLGR